MILEWGTREELVEDDTQTYTSIAEAKTTEGKHYIRTERDWLQRGGMKKQR